MKAETKEDLELAWFAVRLGLCMMAIRYAFGTPVAVAFLAGWWWGVRGKGEHQDEDTKLDDLL
jgi:hypothetical protein